MPAVNAALWTYKLNSKHNNSQYIDLPRHWLPWYQLSMSRTFTVEGQKQENLLHVLANVTNWNVLLPFQLFFWFLNQVKNNNVWTLRQESGENLWHLLLYPSTILTANSLSIIYFFYNCLKHVLLAVHYKKIWFAAEKPINEEKSFDCKIANQPCGCNCLIAAKKNYIKQIP